MTRYEKRKGNDHIKDCSCGSGNEAIYHNNENKRSIDSIR